jgi:hypothetical protein
MNVYEVRGTWRDGGDVSIRQATKFIAAKNVPDAAMFFMDRLGEQEITDMNVTRVTLWKGDVEVVPEQSEDRIVYPFELNGAQVLGPDVFCDTINPVIGSTITWRGMKYVPKLGN